MPRGWCRDDIAPETVAEVLRAQMGAGMPDVFLHFRHAEMQPGLPVTIEADLVIFDGLPGRVRIRQFNFAGSTSWWAAWLHCPAAISFEDGKWVRLDEERQSAAASVEGKSEHLTRRETYATRPL
jgi:hypothetical protein